MKFSSSQKIGFFVIAISVTLFFVINFLKGSNLFSSYNIYYTTLTRVEGLTSTSPIDIRGLKVGKIEDISYLPQSDLFLVKMSVKREYKLPSDSRAEVYSSDILGSKSLRLSLGESENILRNRDTLSGTFIPDMLSSLRSELEPVKYKFDELLMNLNSTLGAINNVFDSASVQSLKNSVSRLNNLLANVELISADVRKATPGLENSMNQMNELLTSLNAPDGDLQKTLSNLSSTSKMLASAELDKTIDELNELLVRIKDPNSTSGKLISTDQLHDDLDNLIKKLTTLVGNIEENPKKYIRVSVF